MSKGLEALKDIRETKIFVDFELDTTGKEMFEKQLNIIETELKALKIIKENNIISLERNKETEKCYINFAFNRAQIGKQEFDLLKEVLCSK